MEDRMLIENKKIILEHKLDTFCEETKKYLDSILNTKYKSKASWKRGDDYYTLCLCATIEGIVFTSEDYFIFDVIDNIIASDCFLVRIQRELIEELSNIALDYLRRNNKFS